MTYDEKLASIYKNTVPLMKSSDYSPANGIVILDTRTSKEFEVSHIEGATFIDYEHFSPDDVADLNKNTKVIVYCSVGYRSERIGEKLLEMGFSDVHNLYGGIFQWVNEGHPIVNKENIATDSVHTYNKKWSKWLKKGVKVYE